MMMTSGSIASTPARATRFFCPKLRKCGGFSANSAHAHSFKRFVNDGFDFFSAVAKFRGPNATSCLTVGAKSWSFGSWNTKPTAFAEFKKRF